MNRFAAALAVLLSLTTLVAGRPACCVFTACCAVPAPILVDRAPPSCCCKNKQGKQDKGTKPADAPQPSKGCTCHAADTHAAPEATRVHATDLAAPFSAIPPAVSTLLPCPAPAPTAGPAPPPPPTPHSLTLPLLL